MKRKSAEEPQPDLEAHFSDGAWYDIILLASDPSRDRFLVQAKDFPDEQEWVDSTVIRPQSQPFEKPPAVGSTVLALHRSQRSDLFFEGVVKDLCNGSHCRIQFTEGRVRGQSIKVPLDDVNRICTRKLSLQVLKSWCTTTKPARAPSAAVQIVEFKEGEFVIIEGPDDGFWVAQLMESYTGRISEEVDDVDDDGPTVKLRWLYKPSELPKGMIKGHELDKKHEVLVSHHRDTIDARLIVRKCKVAFGVDRPRKDRVFEDDELFACRTWDPAKKRITSLDCPTLHTDFKRELKELMTSYPLKRTRGVERRSGDSSPEESKIRLDDSAEMSARFWGEGAGHDEVSDAELRGGKADALEKDLNDFRAESETTTPVGIADVVKRRSRSPVSLVACLSGEKENGSSRRVKEGKSPELGFVGPVKSDICDSISPKHAHEGSKKGKRVGSPEVSDRPNGGARSRSKSPVLKASAKLRSASPTEDVEEGRFAGTKRRSASPLENVCEDRARSKTPCLNGSVESRSPSEPLSGTGEEEGAVPSGAALSNADGEEDGDRRAASESRDDALDGKDGDDEDRSMADTDQLPSTTKLHGDEEVEDLCDAESSVDIEEVELDDLAEVTQPSSQPGVVVSAIAVLVDEQGARGSEEICDDSVEHDDASGSGSPDCASTDLSHDHTTYPITTIGVTDDGSRDDDDCDYCDHSIDWRTWEITDCKQTSDVDAIEGFIVEAVRYACTAYLKQQEFSSVVYFLHRRRGKRELSSVGISACFKSSRAHKKCQKFLRTYAREKKAIAAILIAEDHNVKHPRWTQRCADTHTDGLYVQLDSCHRQGMWHIVPGTASACTFTKLDASQSILRRLV